MSSEFFKFQTQAITTTEGENPMIQNMKSLSYNLNYKTRRKVAKQLYKHMMKSSETYEFSKGNRKEIFKNIMDTLKYMKEYSIQATEHSLRIDLTDDSIVDCFKHFDNPNVEIEKVDNTIYLVRPEEQTKPQRQTEVYQLEQLLDIIKGAVKPKVTFVIKTDEDYDQKIYVFDGQHRLLLVFNFMYNGEFFKKEALTLALKKKKQTFTNVEEWCDEWKAFVEFENTFDGDEFNYDDLIRTIPELENVFKDSEKMVVKGDLHLCDNTTAGLLFRKLNEQISGHSTAQRTKAELVGSKFNNLLFKTKFQLINGLEGYLSDLVPQIDLFNHGLGEHKNTSPKHFGYNLENLDTQSSMNMDQFLIYIYQMLLCKVKITTSSVHNAETGQLETEMGFKFDKNVPLIDSEFYAHGRGQDHLVGTAWKSTGISEKTLYFWRDRFINLQIDDEDEFINYVNDILDAAVVVSTTRFSSAAKRWEDKLKSIMNPYLQEIEEIDETYPSETWSSPSNAVPKSVIQNRTDLGFKSDCIWQYRLENKDQFIVLLSFALSQRLVSKFDVNDWLVGFVDYMCASFNSHFNDQEIETRTNKPAKPRGTKKRIAFQMNDYSVPLFGRQVAEHLEAQDNSLWKKWEAVEKYIKGILEHDGSRLYKCPHTCEWVTIDDFQSHHLHFRSEGDANKVFPYWFPLSSKFNNYISDNHEKNIVDVETDGNFIDACDSMIDMMKTKINQTSDKQEISDWKKSIRTIESWKDQAELWFDENN